MFNLFRKKPEPVTLEHQLKTLSQCGISLNPAATFEDLFGHFSREEYEAAPFMELIPVLGFGMERRDYPPLCRRLWMCDYERIEDHGCYREVIERLHQMTEQRLPISGIADHVDVEEEKAWVEFDLAGTRVHWDAVVDNDWLDPHVVVRFDELLERNRTPFRIYSNHTDFGQSAFFAAMTADEFNRFRKLATFKLQLIKEQT